MEDIKIVKSLEDSVLLSKGVYETSSECIIPVVTLDLELQC